METANNLPACMVGTHHAKLPESAAWKAHDNGAAVNLAQTRSGASAGSVTPTSCSDEGDLSIDGEAGASGRRGAPGATPANVRRDRAAASAAC